MATSKAPVSGEAYTLRELLNGDVTLIIPDMQRDYCWGSNGVSEYQTREKVSEYVRGIVALYRKQSEVNMGLLYGYSMPPDSANILIVDGQQRLTTLYLLLGMLYRRTPERWLRQLLISDYELLDDHRPRLVYQARNEALYFMSDLVTNFFLDRDGRLSKLEQSPWYFSLYESDMSVQSFIGAIRQIDGVLEGVSGEEGWNFGDFARFVADGLMFVYFDLGSRSHAESMFITINTTSEPLTVPQAYKLRLYTASEDKDAFARRWEAMEQWCWQHRRADEGTGDPALERYIRIWERIQDIDPGGDADFFAFFDAYAMAMDEIPEADGRQCVDSPDDMMLMIPTVVYAKLWGQGSWRVWRWLRNVQRYQRALASGVDTAAGVKMVTLMREGDPLSLLGARGVNDRLLNQEEAAKLRLVADNLHQRERVEELIERGQSHPLLDGRLSKLITWSTSRKTKAVDVDVLECYVEYIYEIWGTDINRSPALDDVRLALLALRHADYPIMRRSNTSLTLCWQDYDWQRLMLNAPGVVRQLIDRVASSTKGTVKDRVRAIAERVDDRSYPYNFLLRQPGILRRCAHRSLMRPCEVMIGMYVEDTNTTEWYIEQNRVKHNLEDWTPLRTYGNHCLYTDHRTYNLALDIYYTPQDRQPYRMEIFGRPSENRTSRESIDIQTIVDSAPFTMKYDRTRRRHYYLTDNPAVLLRVFRHFVHWEGVRPRAPKNSE